MQEEEPQDDTNTESDSTPPTSQKLGRREVAGSGNKEQEKQLREICGHCCTGNLIIDILLS